MFNLAPATTARVEDLIKATGLNFESQVEALVEAGLAVATGAAVFEAPPTQIKVRSGDGRGWVYTDFVGVDQKLKEQVDPYRKQGSDRPGSTLVVTGAVPA